MSTELYQRMVAFNYGDDESAALNRKVWRGTPWMLDAYTGDDRRVREILEWCFETFGEQAFAIADRPGHWYRGSATINGWTWFGFSTAQAMEQFAARWPAPEGLQPGRAPFCAFCNREHVGGETCMGHFP